MHLVSFLCNSSNSWQACCSESQITSLWSLEKQCFWGIHQIWHCVCILCKALTVHQGDCHLGLLRAVSVSLLLPLPPAQHFRTHLYQCSHFNCFFLPISFRDPFLLFLFFLTLSNFKAQSEVRGVPDARHTALWLGFLSLFPWDEDYISHQ